jgi:hypothetical protein
MKRDEAKQEKLQKTQDRELKAAETLYKKKQAEAAKVARQHAKEEREKEKKVRAEELAAARALKKQQREAATLQNLAIHQIRASEKPHKALPEKKYKTSSCCGYWRSS